MPHGTAQKRNRPCAVVGFEKKLEKTAYIRESELIISEIMRPLTMGASREK
jgi:hypothetical protein